MILLLFRKGLLLFRFQHFRSCVSFWLQSFQDLLHFLPLLGGYNNTANPFPVIMYTSLVPHRPHPVLVTLNFLLQILNFPLLKLPNFLKTKILLINSLNLTPPFLLYPFHLLPHLTNLFVYLYILIIRIIVLFRHSRFG